MLLSKIIKTLSPVIKKGILTVSVVFILPVFPLDTGTDDYGFRFIRIRFNEGGNSRGFRGRGYTPPWKHDYPTAELNLYEALERTTKIKTHGLPLILSLTDEQIFEYPILYLCEPGYWSITEEETKNLREYLNRGGFILFDDFRGRYEWNNFYEQIKKVFPDKETEEIPNDHPIWSVYYDVDPVEAPSLVSGRYGRYDDRYYTMYDEKGRMMMIVCYNQDIGDGWEWPDRNWGQASTEAFKMGINFIIWALTH